MRYSYLLCVICFLLCLNNVTYASPAHLDTARNYVGTKEIVNNGGYQVEQFLKSVGLQKGFSWCAAFVSYCLDKAKNKFQIRSALARKFITSKSIPAIKVLQRRVSIPKGSLVIWEKGKTINGHIGFVNKDWCGKSGETIEGNTSPSSKGSQENGDGVYIKNREIQPYSYFRITHFTLIPER